MTLGTKLGIKIFKGENLTGMKCLILSWALFIFFYFLILAWGGLRIKNLPSWKRSTLYFPLLVT